MAQWPPLRRQSLASFPTDPQGLKPTGTHLDLDRRNAGSEEGHGTWPCDCRLGIGAGPSLGGGVQRAPAPLLFSKPLYLHQEIFFPGGLSCVQRGGCGAGLRLPSRLLCPVEGVQRASPFPRALRCRIRGPDSHLFIRRLCACNGELGGTHPIPRGRNLQVVHSSS